MDAILASMPANPLTGQVRVLTNWGANDFTVLPTETAWKANYQMIIDAVRVKWPTALVYLSKPWSRGNDTNADTLAGWIDDLVAANPGVAFVADDERVWLKGADDGATMTTDGVHYSAAGLAEKTVQAKAVIWP